MVVVYSFEFSPDSSGNPDIAKDNHDEIASFLAMTDCNGNREIAPKKAPQNYV